MSLKELFATPCPMPQATSNIRSKSVSCRNATPARAGVVANSDNSGCRCPVTRAKSNWPSRGLAVNRTAFRSRQRKQRLSKNCWNYLVKTMTDHSRRGCEKIVG